MSCKFHVYIKYATQYKRSKGRQINVQHSNQTFIKNSNNLLRSNPKTEEKKLSETGRLMFSTLIFFALICRVHPTSAAARHPFHVKERAKSVEWFIEDQAFLPSYDLAPPTPLSHPRVSKLSLYLSFPLCRRLSLIDGEGSGGAKSHDAEKAWSSIINHSIPSGR